VPASEKDPRITPVGNIIRATRLDELPQIFDILSGNMSLVGPRPERIEHVEKYTRDIPEFAYRLKVKGGLTGYAQIFGKYNTTAYDKLKLDLMYVQNYSILLDIKLILMTIKIIFMKESTEGFDEKQISEIQSREK
jgi:lipopolysaccharide/colanic/teichoic acid biosynthesis glycosyltransferase